MKNNQSFVGWPQPYPNPPYTNHPSPGAAAMLGPNYANAPEFTFGNFTGSVCRVINMSGSRGTDRQRLRALTGAPPGGSLRGYDCHHIYDFNNSANNPQCSAQFILRRQHLNSYEHAGAVNQYEVFFQIAYRNALNTVFDDELVSPDEYRTPAAPCPEETVELFESKYRPLPHWLKELYIKAQTAAPAYRFEDGRLEYLYALAPLFAGNDDDCGVDTVLDLGVLETAPLRDQLQSPVPFAFDPCGNIFFTDGDNTYFYDHEMNSCERVTAVTPGSVPGWPEPGKCWSKGKP